jgi:hypothetical protein
LIVVLPESISAILAFSEYLLDVEVFGFDLLAILSVKSFRDGCLLVGSVLFGLAILFSNFERCATYYEIQY